MKRDMDDLNLRDAFGPMPEETRDLMMNTARSLKEEEPVKKATFRTVLIAACIIMATMAAAVAAGSVFGWTDFFKNDYGAELPKTAQEIMASCEPVSWQEGDVVFTVRERYSDPRLAMISVEARLAEGVEGILAADDFTDAIGAYGENSAAVAQRLGVDPSMTWAEAAKQLNLPLYSVRAALEIPSELWGGEQYEDPMFNEDGSLTYFSLQPLNGQVSDEEINAKVYLRTKLVNLEDAEDDTNVTKEYVDLPIHTEKSIAMAQYIIPEGTKVLDAFRIDSIQAELLPSGLHFTANLTALDSATQELAFDKLFVKIVKENGEDYPTGITLSGGFSNLDTWPQIPYTQMISVDQMPEMIRLVFPDANGNDTMLVLQLKK
ncbi:MAG: hypothetical protein Q4G19_01745 [Clostridia bacterium]|nr:hypothetical protein [Clostridia bacterium]